MLLDESWLNDEVVQIRCLPFHQGLHLCLAVELPGEGRQFFHDFSIGSVFGLVECHRLIFRPKPVPMTQRWVVDFQETLHLESPLGEHLHSLDETLRAAAIADEIGAAGFALEDRSDTDCGDGHRAIRVQSRIALQLLARARPIGPHVEAETQIRQRYFTTHNRIAVRLRPDEGEPFQLKMGR